MINILIVDDNSGIREVLKDLLKESSLRFNVVEAENPIDALNLFKKHNYDFDYIICDFFLPIQNGTDFLEVVKSHKKNIKCFLMSSDDSLEERSFNHVDCFFDKSDLGKIVKKLELHSFLVS